MCGIAGIVAVDRLDQDAPARATRMRDIITHRGPDEAGLHCDAHAALAHRRLSIVDLSTGQQPLSNEDGSVWVVFNGEIYNHADDPARARGARPSLPHQVRHRDHRPRLRAVGRRLRRTASAACSPSRSGTRRSAGCCSCAIASASSRSTGRWPATRCCSGRRSRRCSPAAWSRPRPTDAVLPEVLSTRYTSGEETLFRGIHKLLPGHRLVFEGGAIAHPAVLGRADARRGRAREPPGRQPRRAVPGAARGIGPPASDERRAARHVPLRRHRQQRHRRDHGAHDRPAAADLLGRVQGSRVQRARIRARGRARDRRRRRTRSSSTISDFFGALPKLVWHEDEPIAHPSSVPLYFVSALARQHVTVVLTGEGSDELLAGYGKYPRVAWNWRAGTVYERMLPAAVRESIARGVVPMLPRQARPLRAPIVPGDGPVAGVDVLRQLRVDPARRPAARCSRPRCRAAATRAGAYALVARLLQRAERQQHAARSAALRRHQDLPRRAADEAGPDEHGGVDREPRAVPRSQAGRVRRDAARRVEAVGLHDQAHPARVDEGAPAGVDSEPAEDGVPGAVRRLDARARGTASRATCCSTAARASAA